MAQMLKVVEHLVLQPVNSAMFEKLEKREKIPMPHLAVERLVV